MKSLFLLHAYIYTFRAAAETTETRPRDPLVKHGALFGHEPHRGLQLSVINAFVASVMGCQVGIEWQGAQREIAGEAREW